MTNICGHDRDVLRVALARATCANDDPHKAASALAWIMVAERTGHIGPDLAAFNDVYDPAKLAAIMAEEGRRLGLLAIAGPHDAVPNGHTNQNWWLFNAGGECIRIFYHYDYGGGIDGTGYTYDCHEHTMPQARAILLRWLQLPDGAREEAERVLRGEA